MPMFGVGWLSSSSAVSTLLRIALSGCVTSWATDAVISPMRAKPGSMGDLRVLALYVGLGAVVTPVLHQ
jgi:hypothetical protein